MRNNKIPIVLILISLLSLVGCANKKTRLFGNQMPTMQEIHAEKFGGSADENVVRPERRADSNNDIIQTDFDWLPNPTLHMYVFKHLTETGLPVPGYTTFFKMYRENIIAEPSEEGGWE